MKAMKILLRVVVGLLALVGLASFGLDWRKGDFGFFKWDRTPTKLWHTISAAGGVHFRDSSVEFRKVGEPMGEDNFYEGKVTWKFWNSTDEPLSLSFPSQIYRVEEHGAYVIADMPDEIVNAAPITLMKNGVHELQFKTVAIYGGKSLPRRRTYNIAAVVNGKLVLLCRPDGRIDFQ